MWRVSFLLIHVFGDDRKVVVGFVNFYSLVYAAFWSTLHCFLVNTALIVCPLYLSLINTWARRFHDDSYWITDIDVNTYLNLIFWIFKAIIRTWVIYTREMEKVPKETAYILFRTVKRQILLWPKIELWVGRKSNTCDAIFHTTIYFASMAVPWSLISWNSQHFR